MDKRHQLQNYMIILSLATTEVKVMIRTLYTVYPGGLLPSYDLHSDKLGNTSNGILLKLCSIKSIL